MKKLISILLVLLLVLSLAACGEADSSVKALDQCRWVARIPAAEGGFREYFLRVDGENSEFSRTVWTEEAYFGEDSPGFQVVDGKICYGLCGTMSDSADVTVENDSITVSLRYSVLTLERTGSDQLTVIGCTEDKIGPTAELAVGTVLYWEHSTACTSCVEDTNCAYCGQLLTAAPGHSYESGSCIRCGESE